jgi:hypothetical protein
MFDHRPPLRSQLNDATDDLRVERVYFRLRASRDSFTARWGLHLATAAGLIAILVLGELRPAQDLVSGPVETGECMVIIRPSGTVLAIGDSC